MLIFNGTTNFLSIYVIRVFKFEDPTIITVLQLLSFRISIMRMYNGFSKPTMSISLRGYNDEKEYDFCYLLFAFYFKF